MSADAILLSKYKKNRPENAFREVVASFRLDYEYEIEYEYDFSFLVFRLHIITAHTQFIS